MPEPDPREPPPAAGDPDQASSPIAVAAQRIARIVEAAETASEELRRTAERRAQERIAEADRAGALRVAAAEEEAQELLEAARRAAGAAESEARATVAGIHERAAAVREEAEAHRRRTEADANTEAGRLLQDAEDRARALNESSRADAREVLNDAHQAARGVVLEGEELTGNLRALAQSLVRNADKLMRDVQGVNGELVARLEAAIPPPAARPLPAVAAIDRPATASDRDEPAAGRRARREREGRGASTPLPAEIADLLTPDETSLDIPELDKPSRRKRR